MAAAPYLGGYIPAGDRRAPARRSRFVKRCGITLATRTARNARLDGEYGPHDFSVVAGCGVAPGVGERADDVEPTAGLGG